MGPLRKIGAETSSSDDSWRSPLLRKIGAETSSSEPVQVQNDASDEDVAPFESSNLGAWRRRQKRVLEEQRAKRHAQPAESQRKVTHALYRHHNLGGARSVVPSQPQLQKNTGVLKLGAGLARGFPGLPKMNLAGAEARGNSE